MTIAILGGGTFSDVTPHLSLCAKAFGNTAKELHKVAEIKGLTSHVYLTKMANSSSGLVSNSDVSAFVDSLLKDPTLTAIVFSIAMCDFTGEISGHSLQTRLTSTDEYLMKLIPDTKKVLAKIKTVRPDIFLVGFKTTAGVSAGVQVLKASQQINTCSCDLVFANDVITRNNVIVKANTSSLSGPRGNLLCQIMNDIEDHQQRKSIDTMEGYV